MCRQAAEQSLSVVPEQRQDVECPGIRRCGIGLDPVVRRDRQRERARDRDRVTEILNVFFFKSSASSLIFL